MGRPQTDRQQTRLTVSLDERDYQAVCDIAKDNDVSAAWVIRRALKAYLAEAEEVAPPTSTNPAVLRTTG